MGKKRQLERRRAEIARQAATVDARTLRQRLAQGPRAIKAQLLALLSLPGELDADLLAVAAEAAGALRREGDLDDAAKVLELAGAGTRPLRVEAGLLAFCRGDDASLRAIAGATADAALGPLVTLANGARPRPAAPGSPAGVAALAGLARMVSAAAHGDRPGVARAAKEVPLELRPRLFFDPLHAAASLATLGARETGAAEHARLLSESSLVRGDAARESMLGELLAEAAPGALARGAVRAGAAGERAEVRRRAAAIEARRDDAADPMAAALHIAHEAGAAAFANPADGSLLVGFTRLAEGDPRRALLAFDAAIAGGADLVEALRGRWLALARLAQRDVLHGDIPSPDAGHAAETLARALHGRPGAGPYAVLAAVDAAKWFAHAGDVEGVARADALARSYALPETLPGAVAAELEVHRLRDQLQRPDERLKNRLVELTTSMPDLAEAWMLRLDLALEMGLPQAELDELAIEAFAKTRHPQFKEEADSAETRRRKHVPPSPGAALLREVIGRIRDPQDKLTSKDGRLDAGLEAKLAELPARVRHAAQAAVIVELGSASRWAELRAFFGRVAPQVTPDDLGELLVAFAFIQDEATDKALVAALRMLSAEGLASPQVLRLAFDAALCAALPDTASTTVAMLAPHLKSSELTRLRKLLGAAGRRAPPRGVFEACEAILQRLNDALEPGYSLVDSIWPEYDDLDAEPEGDDLDADDDGDEILGLPPPPGFEATLAEMLRQAAPAERERVFAELARMMERKGGPSLADLARFTKLMDPMVRRAAKGKGR